jgi:acetyl-CoA carboxylase carboxyl transferase subunit alpha
VISPEGAASILWHDSTRAADAATNMKITAQDLMTFGIIDGIIPEPLGGAHRDKALTIRNAGAAIETALREFDGMSGDDIRWQRQDKFLAIGRSLT